MSDDAAGRDFDPTCSGQPPRYPPSFLTFLRENDLDVEIFSKARDLPRYVRVNPHAESITPKQLEEQINFPVEEVEGLKSFWVLPGDAKIAKCEAYQKGQIYGMDLSSGVAVLALDVQPDDNVLDICCAPGAKLCMIADLLGPVGTGTVTGVDISNTRAATCRSIVKKYGIHRARIFVHDGTTFNVAPPIHFSSALEKKKRRIHLESIASSNQTEVASMDDSTNANIIMKSRKNEEKDEEFDVGRLLDCLEGTGMDEIEPSDIGLNRSSSDNQPQGEEVTSNPTSSTVLRVPFYAPKMLRNDTCLVSEDEASLYDKVIVDAECTHDGSIVHISKYDGAWGWEKFEQNFMDPERLGTLNTLQYRLLCNGYRLLKPGGILVYSTCSLTIAQNEEVVGRFLSEHHSEAVLEKIESLDPKILKVSKARSNSYNVDLQHALRFDPIISNTSGLFVARIRKIKTGDSR